MALFVAPNRVQYGLAVANHPYLEKLYDLTLAVFENLQDRYDVRAPLHFHSLYDGKILSGD